MNLQQLGVRALSQQIVEIALCRHGKQICRVPATTDSTDDSVTFIADLGDRDLGEFNEIQIYEGGELIRQKSIPPELKHAPDSAQVRWKITVEAQD